MKRLKDSASYLIAPILSLIVFAIFFKIWNFDLRDPIFSYSRDGLFYLFVVKLVATEGWYFGGDLIGYPNSEFGFSLHDFPIHADFFNILMIRIFSFFSKDPIFLANLFFVVTFALNSISSFIALRAFKISILSASLISVIFAFLPYHEVRGVWHLFLSNYAAIPLAAMVSLWLCEGKIIFLDYNKNNQLSMAPNRLFFISFVVAIFVATNGVYYAVYSCVIFMFAWFIHSLRRGNFLNHVFCSFAAICCVIVVVLFLTYLPALIFWHENGFNIEVGNRSRYSSEFYALRIIDLIMPIPNHYLNYLRDLRTLFAIAIPSNGERGGAAIGMMGSYGFLFLLVWILAKSQTLKNSVFEKTVKRLSLKKNDENLISNIASLNLLSLLFATVGGFVMFFVMSFPLLRSHARFCVFIAFFALFLMAIIFDKISQKGFFARIIIIIISILALLDQVGDTSNFSHRAELASKKLIIDRDFVAKTELILKPNAQVFVLPVFGFPEDRDDGYQSLVLYLHSKNLRLSYPSIKGRPANLWQKEVIQMPFDNFIFEVKKAGFSAIIIDRNHFASSRKNGWVELRKLEKNLKSLHLDSLVSKDLNWILFEI